MMVWIEDLFHSGLVTLIALSVLWIGTGLICVWSAHPWTLFKRLVANALSGTFLLLAVGAALRDMNVAWLAMLMGGSLIAHGTDLWLRLSLRRRD